MKVESDPVMSESGVRRAAHYAFIVLCLVALFNYIDRQILVILLESVKKDFGVSDAAMGLLTGTTFSVFYILGSIPLARLADRGVRRNVLALAFLVWSGMTAVCGVAQSYLHLALARASVAASESAAVPISHSLLSDLYPPSRRATVFGILMAAGSVGIAAGLYIGGWVNLHYGWRMAFFVVGIPGVAVALLLRFTTREPERQAAMAGHGGVREMFATPLFVMLLVMSGIGGFAIYSTLGWMPTFLIRVHGMNTAQIGWQVGLATGMGNAFGHLAAGYVGDRLAQRDVRWYAGVASAGSLLAIPFALLSLFAGNSNVAIWSAFAWIFFMSAWFTPTYALAFRVASVATRAQASAYITGSMVLIGLGCGPLLIGALNDHLKSQYGIDAVRYSLLAVVFALVILAAGYVVVWKMVSAWKAKATERDANGESIDDLQTEGAQPDGA
ncbi:spinster family MFS transporter [Paraburkholderia oxyphila]|uniref:spinster family MFS transporter n=1 Tax=Paraburkholderia oxyphila TaxID=614212 RepID=UPI000AAE0922|nr:MFS transporter [Paraburkholderia oxyphila]